MVELAGGRAAAPRVEPKSAAAGHNPGAEYFDPDRGIFPRSPAGVHPRCTTPHCARASAVRPGWRRALDVLILAADLPGLSRRSAGADDWLAGGALWSDGDIDSADVHGPATQRFAVVLMDVLAAHPDLAAAVRQAIRAILRRDLTALTCSARSAS